MFYALKSFFLILYPDMPMNLCSIIDLFLLTYVVPTAAPRDVRVINVTSKSAVIVWSPIPPHLANGDVRYIVRISAVSTSHYTIEESSRETVLMVTGIEAETVHLVTVTGHTGKGAGPGSKVTSFRTQKYSEWKVHTHTHTHTHTIHTHTHTHAHMRMHAQYISCP